MISREAQASQRDERGFALAAVLFVVALLGVLSVTSLAMTEDDRLASFGVRQGTHAFYAGEAGANQVLADWDSLQYDTLMAAPGDSLDLGWQTLPESGASYRAVLRRVDDGGTEEIYDLVVEGSSPGDRGGRQTLMVQIASPPIFSYGVLGKDALVTSGGDVYGNVGSNGNVEPGGGQLIHGDADAGGIVDRPAAVTGTITDGAPPITVPDVACPAGPYGPPPTGGGITWDAAAGELSMSGPLDKTFTSGTYFYHDVRKTGTGNMVIPVGHAVVIYVDGPVNLTGGGFINNSFDAGNLTIYGCDNNTEAWDITGNVDSWLSIYAPMLDLKLNGGGNRHGQFIAGRIDKGGGGEIHYDPGGAFREGFKRVPGSWIQLYF